MINVFNKQEAFKKLAKTPIFLAWHRMEVARRLGYIKSIDEAIDKAMELQNLKIEEV